MYTCSNVVLFHDKRRESEGIRISSMEFNDEFALVQGALISVKTAVGDLQFLSLRNGNNP